MALAPPQDAAAGLVLVSGQRRPLRARISGCPNQHLPPIAFPEASKLHSHTCRLKRRRTQGSIAALPYSNGHQHLTESDLELLRHAANIADSSAGLVQPHPNCGCVLTSADGRILAEAFQQAQGTMSPEEQALQAAGGQSRGCTAYVNMETGLIEGDEAPLAALIQAGVSRVVVGMRYPLRHLRGKAIARLRQAGLTVDLLGETSCSASPEEAMSALQACLSVNEALLHRAATGRPLGILKQRVFEARSRSDAVIVGGNTVRQDNPRLTTRRDGGHAPVRMVMSRTLDLPEDANLWDTSSAPTIVMTQRKARTNFQRKLQAQGVEVVQFDFLTPEAVAAYCQERGFLQCLWECGGKLAAPAIAGGAIHKAMAFIAPKIIGGVKAPSPVGELGNVEMTQALVLSDTHWEAIGSDLLMTGYLPASGGLPALQRCLDQGCSVRPLAQVLDFSAAGPGAAISSRDDGSQASTSGGASESFVGDDSGYRRTPNSADHKVAGFYKTWERWGALSNFSPHYIDMPEGPVTSSSEPSSSQEHQNGHVRQKRRWGSIEHFYQAQKFAGVDHEEVAALTEAIASSFACQVHNSCWATETVAKHSRTSRQQLGGR
ncbi:hypothetical protein WJX84_003994 [Apatococcus fuscideae]|uniref:5-amino-6-(5-phosphoribosylamino)uracil reductase n=1 Tax=Apatococcus fuscideae TaxID=2026836 RepID=A0AAW1SPB3_9CHLO